jgi:large repetitive protein
MRLAANLALLCALLALMVPAAQAGLIGHWTFDEASSGTGTGTALDSSGNHYDGTIVGGAVYATGHVGAGALWFDGVGNGVPGGQHVDVAYNSALALAGTSYTAAWWQKRETNGAWTAEGVIGTNNDIETLGWGAYNYTNPSRGYNDGAINLVHGSGAAHSVTPNIASLAVTDPPSWKHVALVYDKVASTRTLYVGGNVAYSDSITAAVADSGLDLQIGWNGSYFKGAIDDVQIYNQALTAGEVGIVKNGGTVPEPGTLMLCVCGMIGLLAYAWRTRR